MTRLLIGYALALDMTARNLQDEAKKKGLPWSLAKVKMKMMLLLLMHLFS